MNKWTERICGTSQFRALRAYFVYSRPQRLYTRCTVISTYFVFRRYNFAFIKDSHTCHSPTHTHTRAPRQLRIQYNILICAHTHTHLQWWEWFEFWFAFAQFVPFVRIQNIYTFYFVFLHAVTANLSHSLAASAIRCWRAAIPTLMAKRKYARVWVWSLFVWEFAANPWDRKRQSQQ